MLDILFGIKTKKDKKIEELQQRLDVLRNMTIQPKIVYENYKVQDLCSEFMISFEDLDRVNDEYVKRVLSQKLLKVVENNMEIISEDDFMKRIKIFRARLKAVIK